MNNEVWYVLFYSLFLNKIYINFVISCDESARECLRVTNIIWVLAIEYSISMPLWLMSHLRTIIDAFLWTKYWTVRNAWWAIFDAFERVQSPAICAQFWSIFVTFVDAILFTFQMIVCFTFVPALKQYTTAGEIQSNGWWKLVSVIFLYSFCNKIYINILTSRNESDREIRNA